ncbi:hypothetical protein HK099_003296 [Clydaea vesicula]|uniref:Uncharacterized protein n=1 Tax=Clydaea vesicula TaxID=447962 RepID=A0AAD5U265_9FUNG|nr:hypothetical protein HK099_003296 [Clydaea vesicula]KAJ3376690.1 hypothetical protein HDU92_009115 [Lobulomyces angularis]
MFATTNQPTSSDFEVSSPPTDGISSLVFNSQQDLLSATSWDNQTRIYQVMPNGSTQPKAAIQHEGPSLSSAWTKDGTKLLSVGCDKAGRLMDLNTGQTVQVAAHDAPIKSVRFIDGGNMNNVAVTASWDKTVRYWDLRTQSPVSQLSLPERCYTLDVMYPLMVVGTAERHIFLYNLTNPTTIFKQIQSPLKWQTRVVSCFQNGSGFAIGSIEGRVGIQYIEDKDQSSNFSFKCHRDDDKKQVYCVNDISFHPIHGTFSTAGGDGTFNFWDKDAKCRLKAFSNIGSPVSCTAFNKNGSIFAYAASYDWSKGHEYNTQQLTNKIFLHPVKEEDIKPKQKKLGR